MWRPRSQHKLDQLALMLETRRNIVDGDEGTGISFAESTNGAVHGRNVEIVRVVKSSLVGSQ